MFKKKGSLIEPTSIIRVYLDRVNREVCCSRFATINIIFFLSITVGKEKPFESKT